jgi:uncharacterized surface protein with fasciclin (FAS1) repeats
MKITNAKGEVTLSPKEQERESMRNKFSQKPFTTMTRAEKDELLLQLLKDNGYIE